MHILRAVGEVEEQETVPSGKLHDGINPRIVMTVPRGGINEDEPRVTCITYHIVEIPQLQAVGQQLFFGSLLVQLFFVPDPECIQLAVDGKEAESHIVHGIAVAHAVPAETIPAPSCRRLISVVILEVIVQMEAKDVVQGVLPVGQQPHAVGHRVALAARRIVVALIPAVAFVAARNAVAILEGIDQFRPLLG